jgi:hypothetical protein
MRKVCGNSIRNRKIFKELENIFNKEGIVESDLE